MKVIASTYWKRRLAIHWIAIIIIFCKSGSAAQAAYTDPYLSLSVTQVGGTANQPIVLLPTSGPASVQLNAVAGNFTPTSYTWSKVQDSLNQYATTGTATLSATTTTVPQITVQLPAYGVYQFQVTATDGANTATSFTWVNVWDNRPALNPNGVVGLNPGINPPTSVRVLSNDPGPYCHPRVLFSRSDWPTLSGKLSSTNANYSSEAATAVTNLQGNLSSYFDNSSTQMGKMAADYYSYGTGGYTAAAYNQLVSDYTASGAPTGDLLIGAHPTSSLYDALLTACYLAWVGTDPTLAHSSVPTAQQNRFAYLATVTAAAAKFELTYNGGSLPTSNAHYSLALCYDLMYDWMTTQQQTDTRNYLYAIGNGVYNSFGGGLASSAGAVPPGNQQNGQDFPNLADGIVMADLAIEGEQSSVPSSVQNAYYPFAAYATGPTAWPYADPASISNLHRQIRANTEWNLTPWGFDLNMVDYFQLGQNTSIPGTLAFARRGENQFVTANFYQSCLHTIYNLCEREDGAGEDLFDHHDGGGMGDGPGGNSAVYIVKYMFPDDPMVDYFYQVYKHEVNPPNSGTNVNYLCQAIFGVTTNASQTLAAMASTKGLGLTKFDPLRAVAVARNGWNDTDLNLVYEDRWDYDGHMHAERNNFSLYALGRAWSCPAGYHITINDMQATVLIQNSTLESDPASQGYIGQSPSSATQATGTLGNFPTPPGSIQQITEEPNKLWTLFAGDASAAYNYGYVSGSSTEISTGIGNTYFTYPGLVGPLLYADMQSYVTGTLSVNQTGYNAVQYAMRSVITVRGTNPYVLVLDDINKDGTPHNYRWVMPCCISFGNSGGRFVDANNNQVYSSLAIQSGATATDGVLYHAPVDTGTLNQAGLPRLLVHDCSEQSTNGQPAMFIDDRPNGYAGGNLTYGYDNNQKKDVTIPSRRLLIERDNVVAPKYKVLLYPFKSGSTTPTTSWNANNTVLTVNLPNNVTDQLTFDASNADNRTRLAAFSRSTGSGAPTLNLPAGIVVAATGTNTSGIPSGTANFTLTATAANGSALTPLASLPSGTAFPLGVTTVVASAMDALGQETTGTFTVTVTPPPPVLSVTNISNLGSSGYSISLAWPYYPGVTGYNVKRATVSGGPYTTISANQSPSNTSFTDSGLTGTGYYYVVTALLNSYESGNSNEVALAPALTPATFTPELLSNSGTVTSGAGVYQTGTGANSSYFLSTNIPGGIGAFSENGSAMLTPWSGDGIFTVHLASVNSSGNVFSDFGMTFRDSGTATNAAMSFIGYAPYVTTNAYFMNRATDGGLATTSTLTNTTEPSWYRLVRSGSSYTGFYSPDGVNWTQVGPAATQTLPANGYVGMVIGAGISSQVNATFDNLVFLATPSVTPGNKTVALNWNQSIGAASYSVQRATSPTGTFQTITTGLTTTAYTDASVANLSTYYYTVTATSAAGVTTVSPVVSTTPSAVPAPSAFLLPGNAKNYLNWTLIAGASSYTVERGTAPGGPYQVVASGQTGTAYTDAGLSNGTPYYYVIVAQSSGGASPPSSEVSGTPVVWTDQDIGSPSPTGTFAVATNTVTGNAISTLQTTAGGSDIWGTSDQFNYAWRSWTGDGVLIAHVNSLTATNAWTKAGVMFRASLAANAQNDTTLDSASNGLTLQYRTATGTSTSSAGTSGAAPVWVKLTRATSTFTSYSSSDGVTWKAFGSAVTNTYTGTDYAGLAVTSHNNGTACTAIFDRVAFLVTPTSLASPSATAYAVNLTWSTNPNSNPWDATATQVAVSPTGQNNWTVLNSTLSPTATSYTATGLALGTAYDFRVNMLANGVAGDYATLTNVSTSTVTPPTAPSTLGVTQAGASIGLTWNASPTATAYNLKRGLVSGGPYTTLSTGTVTTYSDTTGNPGTTYYYVVTATNAGGESLASNEVSLDPLAAPSLEGVAQSGNAVQLAWGTVTGAASYAVGRSTTSGGPYSWIGTSSTGSYSDATVNAGMSYYYVVSAVDAGGESSPSNQVPITVLTAFQQWLSANNLATSTAQSAVPDHDGVSLLMKYATGLTPGTPSAAGPAQIGRSGNYLALAFNRLNPAPVNYLVESSPDLVNWTALASLSAGASSWTGSATVAESGTNPVQVTVSDAVALPTGTSTGTTTPRFLRLRTTTSTDTLEPSTVPMGDVPVTLAAAATSATSLPLDNAPVARNAVAAVATSTLTVVNAGAWATSSAPYALRLLSGNGSGCTFAITAQAGNALTLATAGVDLTQLVAVGDLYEILPLNTLGSLYGTTSPLLQGGSSAAAADNVLLWNGATWLTYYNNGTSWKQSGSLLSQNNTPLPPGAGLLVTRRGATALNYPLIGRVPEVAQSQYTNPGGTTFLGAAYPVATTLGATGFATASGWRSGGSAASADNVLAWNGATWLTFYFNGTNWKQSGSLLNQSSYPLAPAQPLMIQRQSSPAPANAFVPQPLNYNP